MDTLFGQSEVIISRKSFKKLKRDINKRDYFYPTTGNNTFYTDGFLDGMNSKTKAGGFTVFKNQKHLYTKYIGQNEIFTNNHAELLGVCYAIDQAEKGDEIITDSQNTISWIRDGFSKVRPDLNETISKYKKTLIDKKLNLYWKPREDNLAGNYNEFVLKD